MKKTVLVIFCALIAAASAFGIGKKDKTSTGVQKIRVAHTHNYYPYDFINEKGESDGFEVAVLKEIGKLLPAMGYGEQQMKDLSATIEKTDCDSVVIATPIDLQRVIKINKPCTRVAYSLQEIGRPNMDDILDNFIRNKTK